MQLPYDPHVRLLVGRFVGLSVIISKKGAKLHFHAPIGALVFTCTFDEPAILTNYAGHVCMISEYVGG